MRLLVIDAAVAIFCRKADLLRKVRCFDDDWRRALAIGLISTYGARQSEKLKCLFAHYLRQLC